MLIAIGAFAQEPVAEQRRYFVREPQQDEARLLRAMVRRRFQDPLQFAVRERRNDGSDHHRNRNSGLVEASQGVEPLLWGRGPRFHRAAELPVQRGDRERHLRQVPFSHARENVCVPLHQRRLCHDGHGVIVAVEHLEDLAHELVAAFDRLIGVGIGADGDRAGHIARTCQLTLEQFRGIRLCEQAAFEVEPR